MIAWQALARSGQGCLCSPWLRQRRRPFSSSSSSSPTQRQHLLWSGNLLGYTSDRLTKLPRAWLDSLGVSDDIDQGIEWTHLSSSPTHTLLAYRLLPPRRDVWGRDDTLWDDQELLDRADEAVPSSLPHKVLAIGRNTHAQLGLGFASQEATRGMVTGTLSGRGGLAGVYAGGSTSFVVTKRGKSETDAAQRGSSLYAFGNHTLGQLGLGPSSSSSYSADPYDITPRQESGEAHLVLHPLPREVDLETVDPSSTGSANADGWTIDHFSAGMDHTLLIRSFAGSRHVEQEVVSTGLNTDGQLGLSTGTDVPISPLVTRTFHTVPLPKLHQSDRFVQVAAGADTSFVLSQSGRLFAWGNSEYGQAMLASGVEDRILSPVEVTDALKQAYCDAGMEWTGAKVQKVVAGGSWAGVLDDQGRVWTAGYGPLGLGAAMETPPSSAPSSVPSSSSSSELPPAPKSSVHLSYVASLPAGVTDLHAGLDYALAVGPAEIAKGPTPEPEPYLPRLFTWGLDTVSGRLGLGLGITSSPSDRLRSDPSRSYDRPSGVGMDTGIEQGGKGHALAPRVYTPVEVPKIRLGKSPEDEWLDANPLQKQKFQKEQQQEGKSVRDRREAVGAAEVLDVACGQEAMFVLVEDGLDDVGRWNECYGPPDAGTDVVA